MWGSTDMGPRRLMTSWMRDKVPLPWLVLYCHREQTNDVLSGGSWQ
jgi:hypothetical protein